MRRGRSRRQERQSADVIHDVCTGPNHFLGHPDTLARMKAEYLYPEVFDRASRDDWEAAGEQDIRDIAKAHARNVLENHWPDAIDPAVDKEIRACFDIVLPEAAMKHGGWTGS